MVCARREIDAFWMPHALSGSLESIFTRKETKINDFYSDAWLTVIIQFRNAETIFFLLRLFSAIVEVGAASRFHSELKIQFSKFASDL